MGKLQKGKTPYGNSYGVFVLCNHFARNFLKLLFRSSEIALVGIYSNIITLILFLAFWKML